MTYNPRFIQFIRFVHQKFSWENGIQQSVWTLGKIRFDRRAQNRRFWVAVKYRQQFKEEKIGFIESVWQALRRQCNQLLVKQNRLEQSEKTSTSSGTKQHRRAILLEEVWHLYCRMQEVLHFLFMRLNTTISILTIVQRDATQKSLFIILQAHSTYFGCQPHPSSGGPVPEALVTVLCTPDDGCGWHPKHVEWTCRIINRLLCVASRWTIIHIDQRCTEP